MRTIVPVNHDIRAALPGKQKYILKLAAALRERSLTVVQLPITWTPKNTIKSRV